MVRKIQKTFDMDVLARLIAAATVAYVISGALLHAAVPRGSAARALAGG